MRLETQRVWLIVCGLSILLSVNSTAIAEEETTPQLGDPDSTTPAAAEAEDPLFVLLLTRKPVVSPTPVPARVIYDGFDRGNDGEFWSSQDKAKQTVAPSRRAAKQAEPPQDVLHVFCRDMKITGTPGTEGKLNYRVECSGKLQLQQGDATSTCSHLVYDDGELVLDDIWIRRPEEQGGLFTEITAQQMTIKFPMEKLTVVEASQFSKANQARDAQPAQDRLEPIADPNFRKVDAF